MAFSNNNITVHKITYGFGGPSEKNVSPEQNMSDRTDQFHELCITQYMYSEICLSQILN